MFNITCVDSPISLHELSYRIHFNFSFAWQFFQIEGTFDPIRDGLDVIHQISVVDANHQFLKATYDGSLERQGEQFVRVPMSFQPMSADARFQIATDCESVFANASNGEGGAYGYSRTSLKSRWNRESISGLFSQMGVYQSYSLHFGSEHRLFSNWFNEVAWDWCYLLYWPTANLLWLGCLTDTD